jgi:hypothetical protein
MHETKEKGTPKELCNSDSFFVAAKKESTCNPCIHPFFPQNLFSLTLAHQFIKLECYFGLNFQAGKMVPSKA